MTTKYTLAQRATTGSPQKVCLFGDPKTGKTTLIGTLAEAGFNIIYFDLENGAETLSKLPQNVLENIQYVRLPDTQEFPVGHATIDKIVKGGTFSICLEHGNVNCMSNSCRQSGPEAFQQVDIPTVVTPESLKTIVVIESGTQLAMSITSTILKNKPVDYQETLHDFRNQGNYLNRIFSFLQQAKYNCIMTAHQIEAELEDGTFKLVPSIGTKNYASMVGKFFDHVIYTHKKNLKHKAASSTSFSNTVITGSRLGISIDGEELPNLVEFFTSSVQAAKPESDRTTNILSSIGGLKQQAKISL